ncbi:MAG TPA: hypothetical protein VJB13_00760 [Candidatus Nanoarchaeia archaeon]|nr:hypothetical protein [Candidatus Nanoarchaeia archaeon]
MGLEELTFDVEDVKVILKPELHVYHDNADDEGFLGIVPMVLKFRGLDGDDYENQTFLRYDIGKKIFITSLSDYFVPHFPQKAEKYNQGMAEVARVYSALLQTHTYTALTKRGIITERHFYKNSAGDWKDIGDYWLGVESHEELLATADAVK